jgi:hypothetical protein
VLLAGILGAFGVISGYYDPEPGNDRLDHYFDDPSRMGIILAMVWLVAALFVGDWIAWQLAYPDLTFDAAWSSSGRRDDSPLGELAAQASSEGYKVGTGLAPYHGYYFRILTQQGPNAPGGTLSYVVKGKMIGGFALIAYPAEYGNSGVTTFLVNHAGTVYQKDLGDYTMSLVKRMNWFDPDQTWKKVSTAIP